jgi:hypothetical protein
MERHDVRRDGQAGRRNSRISILDA